VTPPNVHPLDLAGLTQQVLRPWWEVVLAGYAAQDPAPPVDSLPEMTAGLRAAAAGYRQPVLAGVHDPATGRPAGFAVAWLPQRDNTSSMQVDPLVVHPAFRRRGLGTALLDHLVTIAREAGRTVLLLESTEPIGSDGTAVAGTAFARAAGAVDVAMAVQRTLDVQPAADEPAGPAGPAGPGDSAVAPGYELLAWTDATPDELMAPMAVLRALMSVDAPGEDMTLQPEVWDADRVRAEDARTSSAGRTSSTTAARHARTGALVGYTELVVSRTVPAVAFQGDTFVLGAHRGHGLGLAMKQANQRRFRALSPATRTVHTWNAAVNDHMVAINDALGFRPTAQERGLELRIPAG